MLQCNKSPGLDANEIIRLTSAIGQLLPFNYSGKRPFERPLYFGSGQMANSHTSAKTDAQHLSWQ